jgi:squalene synthase HpnD
MSEIDGIIPPDSEENIEELVRRSGTSFYWAMRVLPADKRAAMFAVYAFCRVVDDIADGDLPPVQKRTELDSWRQELRRLYKDTPRHSVSRALQGPVQAYHLGVEDFVAVIDGMETDAVDRLRLADDAALSLYCDQVACAVGRLSTAVFGVERDLGQKLAKALGEALQLTNILRDVDEDADRDHVYLPADLLSRHGIVSDDPGDIVANPALATACEELSRRADKRFSEARDLIALCDRRAVRPAAIMMHVYYRLHVRLKQRGWSARDQTVKVSKLERIGIALRIFFLPGG